MLNKFLILLVLKVLLIWCGLSSVLSVVRLGAPGLGINQMLFGVYTNGFLFFVFCIAIFYFLVVSLSNETFKLSRASLCVLFFLLISIVVGVARNGGAGPAIKHIYMVLFALAFFSIGKNASVYLNNFRFDNYMKGILIMNVLSILLYYVLSIYFSIYPGYGTQGVVYSSIYFLTFGKFFYFLITCLLIVVEGKRSLQISLLLCVLFYYAFKHVKGRVVFLKTTLFVIVSALVCLKIMDSINLYDFVGFSRFKYINPFSENFNIFLGSSGRFDEYICVYNSFKDDIWNYFVGVGVGFNYEWFLSYNKGFYEVKSYLHNVPIMIFLILGPVFTMLFYCFSFRSISKNLSVLSLKKDPLLNIQVFVSLSSLFFLVSGMFSLNSLSDPIGWVFMGLCFETCKENIHSRSFSGRSLIG